MNAIVWTCAGVWTVHSLVIHTLAAYSYSLFIAPKSECARSCSGTAGVRRSLLENRYDYTLPLDWDEACYYRHWVSCDFACHHPCSENWSKNCSHDSIFILCSFSSGNSFHFTVSTKTIKWRTSKGGSIGSTPACGPRNLNLNLTQGELVKTNFLKCKLYCCLCHVL